MKLESKKYRMNLQKISAFVLFGLSINGFATVAQAEGVKEPASVPTPLTAAPKAVSSNDSSNSLSALEAQWQARHQALKTVLFDKKDLYSNLPKDKQAAYVLQAQENLDFAEMHFGENSKQVVQSLIDLASVMPKNNTDEANDARTLLLIALENWEKYFSKDVQLFEELLKAPVNYVSVPSQQFADSAANPGNAFQQAIKARIVVQAKTTRLGDFERFRYTLFTRGISALEKHLGADDKVVVKYFQRLAGLYPNLPKDSNYTKEAQDFYPRVIAQLEKNPKVYAEELANILHGFARFNDTQQNFSEAAKLYLREIAMREQYLPNQMNELERARLLAVFAYENQKEYAKAISVAQKLLTVVEKRESKDEDRLPSILKALDLLAHLNMLQENYREARELYLKKLAIEENRADPPGNILSTLNQLAAVNMKMRQYDQAETLQLKRIAIAEKIALKHNIQPPLIDCLKDLAALYRVKKDDQKAQAIYLRLLDIPEKGKERHIAKTLDDLSVLYVDMQQYDKAEAASLRALTIFEKEEIIDVRGLAFTQMHLGSLYQAKQQFSEAEATYLKALKIYEDGKLLGASSRLFEVQPHLFHAMWNDFEQKITSRLLNLYQQTNQPEKVQALKAKYHV